MLAQERWDRSRRLEWLDVDRLRSSRALVVGAGALGNEVVKALVLSGVGAVDVVDMDRVGPTNLNRCVFFTPEDAARRAPKAEALARGAARLVPEADVRPRVARVETLPDDAWAEPDVVVSCVDNVGARLHLNANARGAGKPVVDAGTEGMRGKVQVVAAPEDACIECATNGTHRRALDARRSCSGAGEGVAFLPPLAQEITTTSVVAAIQAREAVKLLGGAAERRQRGVLRYDGAACTFETLALARDPRCPHHRSVPT